MSYSRSFSKILGRAGFSVPQPCGLRGALLQREAWPWSRSKSCVYMVDTKVGIALHR